MKIDNNTGKNKEFYQLGTKMFDNIKPITPTQSDEIESDINADIELLWSVNSADVEALEDAKMTLEVIRKCEAGIYDKIIDDSLVLINKALGMSYGDAMERVMDKAKGETK